MRAYLLGFGLMVFFQTSTYAKDFYLKLDDANVIRTPINIEVSDKDDIRFSEAERMRRFLLTDKNLPEGWIPAKEPTTVEKAIDMGLMLLTSLIMMGTHQTYHLNTELRLTAMRGVVMFVMPYEHYFLYSSCGGDSYLVAQSIKPTEDSLKRMKTLKEVRELCGIKDESTPSNETRS